MLSKKQAFTLVELIVVITILAILGTIAFMAFGGYSKNARDSVRISDLTTMVTSLNLFETEKGFFPEPSHLFEISYSGSIAWTQGTFGESVLQNVASINEKPEDPLTGDEYAYSITNSKNEFQVATIFEGTNEIAKAPFIEQTYAAESKGRLRVTLQGNYNGQFVKTNSGTTMYILGVPSIITSEIESVDILTILANKTLVYKGYSNLPASYADSGYTMTGGFDFGDTVEPLIFEGTQEDLSDPIDPTARLTLITNLQNLYAGTILETDGNLEQLITTDIDIGSPSDEAKLLAASVVDNTMGTEIVQETGLSGGSSSSSSGGGAECILTQEEVDELNDLGEDEYIYAYIDEERNEATFPLTGEEWCSVYGLEVYQNGNIPDSIWKLVDLYYFYFEGDSTLTTFPTEIENLTSLQELYFEYNSFTSIPAGIGNLMNLHTLCLNNNSLTSLPVSIGNLTNLQYLYLNNNSLTSLPVSIGNLTNLQTLYLDDNSLTSLPEEIGNLTNLQTLYFEDNSLTSLPAEIGNLTNLESLVLNNNSLTSLPEEMENLTNLQTLSLFDNPLLGNLSEGFYPFSFEILQVDIPIEGQTMIIGGNGTRIVIAVINPEPEEPQEEPELSASGTCMGVTLPELTYREQYFGEYSIEDQRSIYAEFESEDPCPCNLNLEQISALMDLDYDESLNLFDVEGIQVHPNTDQEFCGVYELDWRGGEDIPPIIFSLTNLVELHIRNNQVSELPPEIDGLVNLVYFDLSYNNLTTLPPEIGGLDNLVDFDLSSNNFTTLSAEIGDLESLVNLELEGNLLTTLPLEFGDLTHLKDLELSNNNITTLPPAITSLTSLTRLYLGGNDITILSAEIGMLTNLIRLTLDSNPLISLPVEIGDLTNLQRLSLRNSSITSLPVEIGDLTNLLLLTLDSNSLTSLPVEIGDLTNLEYLILDNNSLTSLPVEIGNLESLKGLGINYNSLTSLPVEIGNLESLEGLGISYNSLTSLPSEIGNLTNLVSLTLDYNSLATLPESLENLIKLQSLYLISNPLLGNLSDRFFYGSPYKSQANITPGGETMTIGWDGVKIVVVIGPV